MMIKSTRLFAIQFITFLFIQPQVAWGTLWNSSNQDLKFSQSVDPADSREQRIRLREVSILPSYTGHMELAFSPSSHSYLPLYRLILQYFPGVRNSRNSLLISVSDGQREQLEALLSMLDTGFEHLPIAQQIIARVERGLAFYHVRPETGRRALLSRVNNVIGYPLPKSQLRRNPILFFDWEPTEEELLNYFGISARRQINPLPGDIAQMRDHVNPDLNEEEVPNSHGQLSTSCKNNQLARSLRQMGISDIECLFCLKKHFPGKRIFMPKCKCATKRGYCPDCLADWFEVKNAFTCPVCRGNISLETLKAPKIIPPNENEDEKSPE